ncbi:cell division protein ZapA [Caulobacter sp. KR2-114]|uniref:cell division protein ZapA n=1 Tax=Caulobacter sp. KR2-114 TaxID=3400912 RepID=UPI003C0C6511
MAQLTIEVNGRSYAVGCEDGQEAHLRGLAAQIDAQVRQVADEVGPLGETRLMLMAALMLADELTAAKARAEMLEGELARARDAQVRTEEAAAAALIAAADQLDKLGGD